MESEAEKRKSEQISLILEEFEIESEDVRIESAQMTPKASLLDISEPSPMTPRSSLLEEKTEVERGSSCCKIFTVFSVLVLLGGAIGLFVFLSNSGDFRNEASETLPDLSAAAMPVPCTEKVMLICMSAERIGDDLFFNAADEESFECLQNISLEESCERFLKEIQRKEELFYDAFGDALATTSKGESDNTKETGEHEKRSTQEARKKIGKFFQGVMEYSKENKKAKFCVDCSIGQFSKWVFQKVFLPNLKLAGLFTDQLAMQTLEKQFIDLSVKHEDRLNLKEHLKKLPENLIATAIVLLYLPTLLVLFPGFTAAGTIPLVGNVISLNSTATIFPIFVSQMVKVPEKIWAFVRRSPEMQPSLEVFKSETKMFYPAASTN